MQRRNFIKDSALCAVAVSASGFIRFDGTHYAGDCETTTDILGPFYRPDAPVRSDLRIKGAPGQLVVLSGQVKQKDCTTPLANATVELWHCDAKGVYDNDSPEFKYRAKTYCDKKGNYQFKTVIPVPYDVGNGNIRPAHFHLMVSAPGYQSLITQLYFSGDEHISKDAWASTQAAKRRILNIKAMAGGEKSVVFNVSMMDKLPADVAVIERLSGVYKGADNAVEEFFKRDNMLWIKSKSSINGGYPLQYAGNNNFEEYGGPATFNFNLQSDGSIKLTLKDQNSSGNHSTWEGIKSKG